MLVQVGRDRLRCCADFASSKQPLVTGRSGSGAVVTRNRGPSDTDRQVPAQKRPVGRPSRPGGRVTRQNIVFLVSVQLPLAGTSPAMLLTVVLNRPLIRSIEIGTDPLFMDP